MKHTLHILLGFFAIVIFPYLFGTAINFVAKVLYHQDTKLDDVFVLWGFGAMSLTFLFVVGLSCYLVGKAIVHGLIK